MAVWKNRSSTHSIARSCQAPLLLAEPELLSLMRNTRLYLASSTWRNASLGVFGSDVLDLYSTKYAKMNLPFWNIPPLIWVFPKIGFFTPQMFIGFGTMK